MANQDVEIEIKLPLNNPKTVKKFLNKQAKIISKNVFQKDTYFVPPHRDFLNAKYPFEWLRLRELLLRKKYILLHSKKVRRHNSNG